MQKLRFLDLSCYSVLPIYYDASSLFHSILLSPGCWSYLAWVPGTIPKYPTRKWFMMVPYMAVTHCLFLPSRNIQLPSHLDWNYSKSWHRSFSLKTLLELGSNLLSFHVFSSSPLSAFILCLDIVLKKLQVQGLPQTQSCL